MLKTFIFETGQSGDEFKIKNDGSKLESFLSNDEEISSATKKFLRLCREKGYTIRDIGTQNISDRLKDILLNGYIYNIKWTNIQSRVSNSGDWHFVVAGYVHNDSPELTLELRPEDETHTEGHTFVRMPIF